MDTTNFPRDNFTDIKDFDAIVRSCNIVPGVDWLYDYKDFVIIAIGGDGWYFEDEKYPSLSAILCLISSENYCNTDDTRLVNYVLKHCK